MRRPSRQRNNPKARRILTPPPGIDLAEVAKACRYVGSPYHKGRASFAGTSHRRRPDASLCPDYLAECPDLVERWFRDAIRAGQVGAWDRGFPRYVWHREGEVVFEARQGAPGSGEYHGYPLTPRQRVRGLR